MGLRKLDYPPGGKFSKTQYNPIHMNNSFAGTGYSMQEWVIRCALVCGAFIATACNHGAATLNTDARSPATKPVATKPATKPATRPALLYHRLGGEKGIRYIVDDFVARAAVDPEANLTRKGTGHEWIASPENMQRLKQRLVEFIASSTSGPIKYEGTPLPHVAPRRFS